MKKWTMSSLRFGLVWIGLLAPFAAWSTPVYMPLGGAAGKVPVGDADAAASADTGRAAFTGIGFWWSDSEPAESTSRSVSSSQTLAASESGDADLYASAGGDRVLTSISLSGREDPDPNFPDLAPGDRYPLFALAGEVQVLRVSDPSLAPGTLVPVEMDYKLGLSLQSAASDHRAYMGATVNVYERTPLLTPDEIGIPDIFQFEQQFGHSIDARSEDGLGLLFDELISETVTLLLAVDRDYMVHMFSSVAVIEGSVGLEISAYADPVFRIGNCSICGEPSIARVTTAAVPEPGALSILVGGLAVLAIRRRTSVCQPRRGASGSRSGRIAATLPSGG